MKKVLMVAVAAVFGVFAVSAGPALADEKKIDWPEAVFGKAKTKTPPTFNHEKHGADLGCVTCHHTEPDLKAGGQAKTCITEGCHGATADGKKLTAKDIIHKVPEGRCLACHKTDEKAKAAGAPTKCNDCHPKG